MALELNCLRCKGPMKRGFLLDYSDGSHYAANWIEGIPEKSQWGAKDSVKIPRARIEVATYRCSSCGYLESYANSPAIEGGRGYS
jgi:hypothetical protein